MSVYYHQAAGNSFSLDFYHDYINFFPIKLLVLQHFFAFAALKTPDAADSKREKEKNNQQNKKLFLSSDKIVVFWNSRKMREKLHRRGIDTKQQQRPTDTAIYLWRTREQAIAVKLKMNKKC